MKQASTAPLTRSVARSRKREDCRTGRPPAQAQTFRISSSDLQRLTPPDTQAVYTWTRRGIQVRVDRRQLVTKWQGRSFNAVRSSQSQAKRRSPQPRGQSYHIPWRMYGSLKAAVAVALQTRREGRRSNLPPASSFNNATAE